MRSQLHTQLQTLCCSVALLQVCRSRDDLRQRSCSVTRRSGRLLQAFRECADRCMQDAHQLPNNQITCQSFKYQVRIRACWDMLWFQIERKGLCSLATHAWVCVACVCPVMFDFDAPHRGSVCAPGFYRTFQLSSSILGYSLPSQILFSDWENLKSSLRKVVRLFTLLWEAGELGVTRRTVL